MSDHNPDHRPPPRLIPEMEHRWGALDYRRFQDACLAFVEPRQEPVRREELE